MRMRSVSNLLALVLAIAGCIVAIVLTYEEFHPQAVFNVNLLHNFGVSANIGVMLPGQRIILRF